MHDLTKHRLCYLATPYSKYRAGLYQAFADAAVLAAKLIKGGVKVYSPIAHSHPIAFHGDIDPLDHSIWLPFEERLMGLADALIVAQMDGWRESYGVAHEITFFVRECKPIIYLDPATLATSDTPLRIGEPCPTM